MRNQVIEMAAQAQEQQQQHVKVASECVSAKAAAEASLASKTEEVKALSKRLNGMNSLPEHLRKSVESQIDRAREQEQRTRSELADATRGKDEAKRSVGAMQEELAMRERQIRELQQSKRDIISEEGGGLAQSLADTYESVMSEEFRVMKEAYETKLKCLKEQMSREQKAHRNEIMKSKDAQRGEMVSLDMKMRRHEATIAALTGAS